MSKEQSIEFTVEQLIDALIKAGAKAVGVPQLVELKSNADGYLDIPMKVRVAV